jgi:threonine/homoserine/homoserine lactone efflux protein
MTTYKSISAIFISLTNPKVIACVGTILNTIINKLFLPSTITIVVIILHSEVFSTYIST